jgi:peptide/nickel transport system substrate-binding protein
MMPRFPLSSVVLGLLAFGLVAAGCQPRESATSNQAAPSQAAPAGSQAAPAATAPAGKPGGTLTLAISKDITILNPLVNTNSTELMVRDLIFEPLVALDRNGQVQPHLAESWEISSDGLVYTFRLRRGVKFHDGQEMTAADVKFAFDYTLEPKNGAYGYKLLSPVDRAEAPDSHTLRMVLKRPSPVILPILGSINSVGVIPNGSLQEGVDKPSTLPPGTGPFRFVEWQPRQRIVVERNENYWGHKPYLDRVILAPIADDSVRFTALRAGDVDLVERTPYEWVRQVLDGSVRGIGIAEARQAGYRRLMFNAADPPFDNKKLRQAVVYAVDKQELLQAAFFGFGTPVDQKYARGHTWYFEGLTAPTLDLEKSRALLREAGYNGEVLEIASDGTSTDQTEATTLQAQLRRAGINARINTMEPSALRQARREGGFQFLVSGSTYDPDPSMMYNGLRCEADPRKRSDNSPAYCDKDVEAWLDRGETEMDANRRREIYRQVVAKSLEDVPEVAIGFVPRFFTFRDYVKGFTTSDEGSFLYPGGGLPYTWLDK